jgi:recombination protein RecR
MTGGPDLKITPAATAAPVARLIEEFGKLPGIGPKSAQRMTYYLLRVPSDEAKALAEAILALKEQISFCPACFNITDTSPCGICADSSRERDKICVVEEPLDILPLERTRRYRGLYHVLHGVISPGDGVGPDDLRVRELLARVQAGGVTELILATNPNVEGEATAMYLQRLFQPMGLKVTRLARGLPYGADLEYADEATLTRALEGRQQF